MEVRGVCSSSNNGSSSIGASDGDFTPIEFFVFSTASSPWSIPHGVMPLGGVQFDIFDMRPRP